MSPVAREDVGVAAQVAALQTLLALPVGDAIGAACSFLLDCAYRHPALLRRVLDERVVREGFRGVSLLQMFKRACQ